MKCRGCACARARMQIYCLRSERMVWVRVRVCVCIKAQLLRSWAWWDWAEGWKGEKKDGGVEGGGKVKAGDGSLRREEHCSLDRTRKEAGEWRPPGRYGSIKSVERSPPFNLNLYLWRASGRRHHRGWRGGVCVRQGLNIPLVVRDAQSEALHTR